MVGELGDHTLDWLNFSSYVFFCFFTSYLPISFLLFLGAAGLPALEKWGLGFHIITTDVVSFFTLCFVRALGLILLEGVILLLFHAVGLGMW